MGCLTGQKMTVFSEKGPETSRPEFFVIKESVTKIENHLRRMAKVAFSELPSPPEWPSYLAFRVKAAP